MVMKIFIFLALSFVALGSNQDFKDTREVHKYLEHQRKDVEHQIRDQKKIQNVIDRFVVRNHCETKNATLDNAGFMICTPKPAVENKTETPKP